MIVVAFDPNIRPLLLTTNRKSIDPPIRQSSDTLIPSTPMIVALCCVFCCSAVRCSSLVHIFGTFFILALCHIFYFTAAKQPLLQVSPRLVFGKEIVDFQVSLGCAHINIPSGKIALLKSAKTILVKLVTVQKEDSDQSSLRW
mmetsp:Transcript_26927/g.79580  ORF Transcript_26927/g.79580 Transcript_26927/m.79580 type:complete len:143 (-) Transcript_26927:113-541(-)